MKVLTGKVVDGHIDFKLDPEQVTKLEASLDQATQGEVVDGWQLLRDLRA